MHWYNVEYVLYLLFETTCAILSYNHTQFLAGIYLFNFNNRNTRTMCEICLKLTIKTPERRHWRRSGVFIGNFKQISHVILVFLLSTLNKQMSAGLMCWNDVQLLILRTFYVVSNSDQVKW